jgi:hypothetical protein
METNLKVVVYIKVNMLVLSNYEKWLQTFVGYHPKVYTHLIVGGKMNFV